jgi:hypothetical protein
MIRNAFRRLFWSQERTLEWMESLIASYGRYTRNISNRRPGVAIPTLRQVRKMKADFEGRILPTLNRLQRGFRRPQRVKDLSAEGRYMRDVLSATAREVRLRFRGALFTAAHVAAMKLISDFDARKNREDMATRIKTLRNVQRQIVALDELLAPGKEVHKGALYREIYEPAERDFVAARYAYI